MRGPTGRRSGLTALVALAAALAGVPAVAQQASIRGIVTSSRTGSPLEGVTVLLESAGRQAHGSVTDRNGFYQIGGIAPGTAPTIVHRLVRVLSGV